MRRWGAIVLISVLAGCARVPAAPPSTGHRPSASPTPSTTPFWNSVERGCPTLSGPNRELVVDGPAAMPNGRDDEFQYTRGCSYGKLDRAANIFISVDISRAADPGSDRSGDLAYRKRIAHVAGHIVIALPGIGGGGLCIVERATSTIAHPVVHAETYSGNALVTAIARVDRPIHDEQDLRSHNPEMIAILTDVLDDLRP